MTQFALGIAGGTGSGKSTLAQAIAAALDDDHVAISEDSYYLDQSHLPMTERALVNYDHPDSLELDLLSEHLRTLRSGQSVDIPRYDFKTHSRQATTRRIDPHPIVLVEGILALSHAAMRDVLDFRVYVDTPAHVRLARRIKRDVEERGRVEASVREQFDRTAQPMHKRFVEPSRHHAHLVLSGESPIAELVDAVFAALDGRVRRGGG